MDSAGGSRTRELGVINLMLEAFTAGAERALVRAGAVARRRGGQAIEPLDLLAALSLEVESRAAELLEEFGVSAGRLREALGSDAWDDEVPEADDELDSALPRSSSLRMVLGEATNQARGLDRTREVGTEHLLAGLMAAPGPIADLLRSVGLELAAVRDRLAEVTAVDAGPLPMADDIPPLDLAEPGGGVDLGRILDASANRAREGLRVVEDYVRFVLDDPGLTRRLKEVRHRFSEAERGLGADRLLDSRETLQDVGTHIMTTNEQFRENPRAVLSANFKRLAEAMRSLEEYSKLVDVWLAGRFEVLRYDIYTLEKLTMTAAASHRTLGEARLMVLVGGLRTLGDLTWVVEEAIRGGADVIQYREKGVPDRELLKRAREVRIVTARARVPMIMNDRPDLARLAGCDGVHLGQEDVTIRDARRVVGPSATIGQSTHDREQLEAAVLSGSGYLGVGPVFPSATKEFSEPELAGLAFVRLAAESTALPWFAIGGIGVENIDRVIEAGATRVAVSSAVVRADSPRRAAARLKTRLIGVESANLEDDDF